MKHAESWDEITSFFDLRDAQTARLMSYVDLLRSDGRRVGLIGFPDRDIPEQIVRALLFSKAMGQGDVIDVGSGAGLPGIPLEIVRGGVTLVEPKRRAVAFLEKVARTLELDVRVVGSTAEEAGAAGLTAPYVVARALRSPMQALDLCFPLCEQDGTILLAASTEGPYPSHAHLIEVPGPLDIVQRILMMGPSTLPTPEQYPGDR